MVILTVWLFSAVTQAPVLFYNYSIVIVHSAVDSNGMHSRAACKFTRRPIRAYAWMVVLQVLSPHIHQPAITILPLALPYSCHNSCCTLHADMHGAVERQQDCPRHIGCVKKCSPTATDKGAGEEEAGREDDDRVYGTLLPLLRTQKHRRHRDGFCFPSNLFQRIHSSAVISTSRSKYTY